MPVVQLAAHAKSSTLYGRSYGRTSKFFRLDGLLLFCIIMGLRSASSDMIIFRENFSIFFLGLGMKEMAESFKLIFSNQLNKKFRKLKMVACVLHFPKP